MLTEINTAEIKRRVRLLWFVGCSSLILAIVVLAGTSWTVYSNWDESREDVARAQSNRTYLRTLNNLLSSIEDAESAQRGYLLTGQIRYLDPYNAALKPISESLNSLSAIAVLRPDVSNSVKQLQSMTRIKMGELALTIRLQQANDMKAAMAEVSTDRGLKAMNDIRALCKSEGDSERADVLRRTDDSEKHQAAASKLGTVGGTLILCLMIAGFFALTSGAAQQTFLAERLANSREMFETTLTSIGDGVIATDTSGDIQFMNPEAATLTGWSRSDVIGRHLDEVLVIINESSRQKVESPFVQVMRTGSATAMANHTLLIRRDGSEIPIDDSGAPILNTYGRVNGVVLVFRGIEQRRKAEDALRQSHNELLKANEELRQFSYAATHDLQEPLRTIVVFSQLLGRNYKQALDERGHQLLQTVEDAGQRMSALINDLLSLTRVSTNEAPNELTAVDATSVLSDTLIQLNGAIEETKAVIQHDKLPNVWSEPAQLSQLFQNLISNAIKYRSKDLPPRIEISSTVDGEFATFQISDNGMGFKQEYADRIFLLFQRLHGRTIPGTGIGLALCRRIVERQGGRIWAISEENRGSSFFFTLPVVQTGVTAKQLLPQ